MTVVNIPVVGHTICKFNDTTPLWKIEVIDISFCRVNGNDDPRIRDLRTGQARKEELDRITRLVNYTFLLNLLVTPDRFL
jgi:hypothetical protein